MCWLLRSLLIGTANEKYETLEAYNKSVAERIVVDPNAEYIPKLLAFEEDDRGEDVGLLALWHVFRGSCSWWEYRLAGGVQ